MGRPLGRLLVVDYVRPQDSRPEGVIFVFNAGVLDEADLGGLALAEGEILSAELHSLGQARPKVKPLLAARIEVALVAARQGVTALCEHGVRIA